VFEHALVEIACHAGVEISRTAGEDVDGIDAIHGRLPEKREKADSSPAKKRRVRNDNIIERQAIEKRTIETPAIEKPAIERPARVAAVIVAKP
jgi:hypothetical protein